MAVVVFSLLFILFTIEVLKPKKSKNKSNLHHSKHCCDYNIQDRKSNLEGNHPKTTHNPSAGTRPSKSRG
ncbi:hypothetical protein J0895_14120 [Phormidium pseudopriestleyi FRX01]|uniref:Secreted protein n=1 Tax=Phormidium pseudopriestleyi FRX01 TaxID=1759528 RepID=A0ABS3FSY8_9CYAN|nr:hypothetical protein [Phormidium pseudopriestleyi]MBO0350227.1 hypothetical protein [Phormidium pseudopriestleyi FRX01]